MKKQVGLLSALICVVALVACGGAEDRTELGSAGWLVEPTEQGYSITDPEGQVRESSDVHLTFGDGEESSASDTAQGAQDIEKAAKGVGVVVIICDECHKTPQGEVCTGCKKLPPVVTTAR